MQQKVIEITKKKRPQTLKSEITTVTPEIAKAWLDKNISNRAVRKEAVEAYARAIQDDQWLLSGDAIRFDVNGNLIDGQHRLLACVRANTPFRTVVIYGLPAEVKETIDTNVPRRGTDVLHMNAVKAANHTMTAIRWLVAAQRGYGTTRDMPRSRTTNQEALAVIRQHPLLNAAVVRVARAQPKGVSVGGLGFVIYIAEQYLKAPELAQAFLTVFVKGVPSRDGCPAHLYRERMLRMTDKIERANPTAVARGLIHAWNQFASGEVMQTFRFPATEVWIAGLDKKTLQK